QLNADGTFNYTPDKDFGGTDSFSYKLTDSHGHSSIGTVTVVVDAVANLPAILDVHADDADAGPSPNDVSPKEDAPVALNVTAQFGDFTDGSESHAVKIEAPPPGWTVVSLNGWTHNADGSFTLDVSQKLDSEGTFSGAGPTLQPPPDFHGTISLQVEAI